MKCPICDIDLSPLDLVSKTEHVNSCIENGPPGKQRKICPICDKTFQNLSQHFKVCAIKNDVPPNLMLEYWGKINSDGKSQKKFPRELLDSFVAKCVKEGRLGEQVDIARALSLSLAENEPISSRRRVTQVEPHEGVAEGTPSTRQPAQDAAQVIMQNSNLDASFIPNKKVTTRKRYRLELVDEQTRRANIELRIDRELAATRVRRYREALNGPELTLEEDSGWSDKLFFLSRLKNCDGSELCSEASCQNHELTLSLEEFKAYSGASMDAAPKVEQEKPALA